MKNLLRNFAVVAISLSAATSTSAAIIRVQYTGTVGASQDLTGVFGKIGSLEGDAFTSTFFFDTAKAYRSSSYPFTDTLVSNAYPALGATLRIKGVAVHFTGSYVDATGVAPVTGQIVTFAASVIQTPTNLDVGYVGTSVLASNLPSSVTTPFSADGIAVGDKVADGFLLARGPGYVTTSAGGSLLPTHVTVSIVPEPATWAMMLVGIGFMGCSFRTNRKAEKAKA